MITKLVAHNARYVFVRQRRGLVYRAVYGRYVQMGHHYAADSLIKNAFERVKLQRIQLASAFVNHRQVVVAVYAYIAMAGKMLGAGHHAGILHAFHNAGAKQRHFVFVLPKTAHSNHRVGGVVVDVHHRGIIHMNVHTAALLGNRFAGGVHQCGVGQGPQCQLVGKILHPGKAHAQAPFCIHRYHYRGFGRGLHAVKHSGVLLWRTLKSANGTNIIVFYQLIYFGIVHHGVAVAILAAAAHHHQLGNAFVGRKGSHHAVGPTFGPFTLGNAHIQYQ